MPWYRDLDLRRRGAVCVEPPLNVAMLLKNGGTLEWWTDFEKTAQSVGSFSRKDEKTIRRWRDAFLPILDRIVIPESQSPPLEPAERRRLLERTAEGRLFLEVSALSPLEFVTRELESPVVQAGMLFFNGLREVDLRARGFGHHIPALLASRSKAQMCVGGSAALARALCDAVRESGGEILTGVQPARIRCEQGRAVAVETAAGDVFRARHFIASGLNPQQTFLDLVDAADLGGEWRGKAAAYRYNLLGPALCREREPAGAARLCRRASSP
jgi:phytoene dehydrogenase-like protein